MRLFARIKCALGKHQWRYYHRTVREYRGDESALMPRKRRACVHCKKRETVPAPKDIHEAMAQAIKVVSGYIPPEGVSNESGAPAQES